MSVTKKAPGTETLYLKLKYSYDVILNSQLQGQNV